VRFGQLLAAVRLSIGPASSSDRGDKRGHGRAGKLLLLSLGCEDREELLTTRWCHARPGCYLTPPCRAGAFTSAGVELEVKRRKKGKVVGGPVKN
jgi:hypothetical protein